MRFIQCNVPNFSQRLILIYLYLFLSLSLSLSLSIYIYIYIYSTTRHLWYSYISILTKLLRTDNRPLRWCIWCNLDGVFLIYFSTFRVLLFYLYIENFLTFLAYSILFLFWSYSLSFSSFLIDLVVCSFYTFRFIVSP